MVKEAFGVDPDPWQLEVLSIFPSMNAEHMRIGLKACAGPGKTALLAWLGWNFLACYGNVGSGEETGKFYCEPPLAEKRPAAD